MPLQHSSSPEAFKSNLKAELAAGKPRDQSLAIAYSVKRKGRAAGGSMPAMAPNSPQHLMRAEAQGMHTGAILSNVPGRTDRHNMNVPSGAYVFPADFVSHLGQNNTLAGASVLHKMMSSGPYGSGGSSIKSGAGAPRAPAVPRLSDTGGARGSDHSVGQPTPVVTAGGEVVAPPEWVTSVGRGNLKHGHQILDHWVMKERADHIKTLRGLPPPAKS